MIRKSIAQKSAVYHYQLTDNPHAWLIMLAPGCGIEEARRVLDLQYPGRVLAVRGHATHGDLPSGGKVSKAAIQPTGGNE